MATDTENSGGWKKRESFGSAMVQIIIVAALLAGTVFLVYRRGSNKRDIAELMTQARAAAIRGNMADLRKAITIADEALAKDANAGDPNAFEAAMYTDLWLVTMAPRK